MLKALLVDRLRLVLHDDQKPLDVFTLTLVKRNSNLKEAEAEAEGESQGGGFCKPPDPPPGGPYTVLNCQRLSMESFAVQFRQYAQVAHRIVDATGLKGPTTSRSNGALAGRKAGATTRAPIFRSRKLWRNSSGSG
jgi:uncharacterized protein (TIGR03435 family)